MSPQNSSSETATRQRLVWYWALLVLIAMFFFALSIRGIAAPWHWGHNGHNGAAFSQAAKNSARFGIVGQAPFYFEREPPPSGEIYTHHPMALHAHLVGSFAVFGTHEWSARLVPLLYSVATWLLLFVAVRRYWGDRTALLACMVYALTPLNLIFANMVCHQQGGIFACLWLVYAYLRWFETDSRLHAILCMIAVTLAAQFDWPGYYVAFAVAAHCAVAGIRGTAPPGWRRFILVFSTITLLNFVAFFGWIYLTRSGLDEMLQAFRIRHETQSADDYLTLLGRRLLLLYGPLLLSAATIGALVGLRSWRGGQLSSRVLLPLSFLFAGLLQVTVFPQAAALHAYWIYYWSPAVAIGAAIGLDSLICWGRALVRRLPAIRVDQAWVAPFLVFFFLLFQGSSAWRTWHEQLDHGHAADCNPCEFQHLERSWFTALAGRYDTASIRYALHSSIREPRIELFYYLDAPYRLVERVWPVEADEVLLLDLDNVGRGERNILPYLSRTYPTVVWNNRFYAIDMRSKETKLTRFDAVADERSPINWWLTTQTSKTPVRWRKAL